MPLGDSITVGGGSTPPVGGYRVHLFQTTITNVDHVTFVGRMESGPTTVGGRPFPRQHEGYSGYTIEPGGGRAGISSFVDGATATYQPHIILLKIGTNDVDIDHDLANAPTRLGALIDRITTGAPGALLVVANLVPTRSDVLNARVRAFNDAIPGLMQARAAAGKHVVAVDMYTAFVADANYKTTLLADTLHPNDAGYAVMAENWYAAIHPYLPTGP
jgi:lysophospholipase L1-like esterase